MRQSFCISTLIVLLLAFGLSSARAEDDDPPLEDDAPANPFADGKLDLDQFQIGRRPDKYALDDFKVQSFVGLPDFLKLGYECYRRYVLKRGAAYEKKIEDLRRRSDGAVAMLEVRVRGNKERARGYMSGTLINDGKHFLTAGHFEMDANNAYLIHINDGRKYSAKLASHRSRTQGDWAIFELTTVAVPGPQPGAALVTLPLSLTEDRGELYAPGYPCSKYLFDGRIVSGGKCNYRGRPLPVLAQKTSELEGTWVLTGLAGATPLPGSSGSPVISVTTGKVIGIYVAQSNFDPGDLNQEVPTEMSVLQAVPLINLKAELERLKIPFDEAAPVRQRGQP